LPENAVPLKAVRRSAWLSVSLCGPKPGAGSSLLWAEAQGREGGESSLASVASHRCGRGSLPRLGTRQGDEFLSGEGWESLSLKGVYMAFQPVRFTQ
jgi:hypothetical protein